MNRWLQAIALILGFGLEGAALAGSATNEARMDVLIVAGAAGEKEFQDAFSEIIEDWRAACQAGGKAVRILEASTNSAPALERIKAVLSAQSQGDEDLWIILVGHGTFDGKEAKFNLPGPDLSAREMKEMLGAVRRPVILVNASSSSAPFINELSSAGRIVVSATKSGWEENYSRFGIFFAKAVADLVADLDKDGQVSVLEAFLMASRQTEDFYKNEKRLATEHALLDDNGDSKGTPASFFRGVRPDKKPEEAANVDGFRAHQVHFIPSEAEAKLPPSVRKRRNELELELERLRGRKPQLGVEDYLKAVEPVLLELARLYRDAEKP